MALDRYGFQETIYDNASESEQLLDEMLARLKAKIVLYSEKRRGEINVHVNLCFDKHGSENENF